MKSDGERLRALENRATRIEAQLEERAIALKIAQQTVDARLTAMNELRNQIERERTEYVTRKNMDAVEKEFIVHYESNRDAISLLSQRVARGETTTETQAGTTRRFVGVGLAVVAIIVSLVSAVGNHAFGG